MKIDVRVEEEFLAAVVQRSGVIDPDVLHSTQPEHFQVESYQWMVKLLRERDWSPPVWDFMEQEFLSLEDEDVREKHRLQIWNLYAKQLTFEQDASDRFRAYVAYCVANTKTRSAYEGFARTSRIDFLFDELHEAVLEGRRVVEGSQLEIVDYASTYEERVERRRVLRDNPATSPRVLTGIQGLDAQFTIRAPMLVDFLAPFKRYKSIFLNAMGYSTLLQGFNVLHVTYENSQEMTMDRYDAMFSELNYERVSGLLLTQAEKDAMDATFRWMSTWGNRLKVIKATPEETTVPDIESELEHFRVKEGWIPDVEVWDYLNIIAPSRSFREERRDQKQIVWDLKRHAEKFSVPLFVASQANMEGATVERIGLKHRGLSTDISRALDLSIAIDQTDEEKAEGIIVLSPQFVRGGSITIPEVVLDADLPRMTISRELHRLWAHAVKINPYITGT